MEFYGCHVLQARMWAGLVQTRVLNLKAAQLVHIAEFTTHLGPTFKSRPPLPRNPPDRIFSLRQFLKRIVHRDITND
jgi:hypothetical protein